MSKITKADGLANGFDAFGIEDAEDREAIAEAVAGGTSFADAANELGYSAGAIAPVKSSSAPIAPLKPAPAVQLDFQNTPNVDWLEDAKQDYLDGQTLARTIGDIKVRAFADGVDAGVKEVQQRNAEFFRSVQGQVARSLSFRVRERGDA